MFSESLSEPTCVERVVWVWVWAEGGPGGWALGGWQVLLQRFRSCLFLRGSR